MQAVATLNLSPFAIEVADGLDAEQKRLPSSYLYDSVGSSLFSVIAKLPEYGTSRAEDRLLRRYGRAIGCIVGPVFFAGDLANGAGDAVSTLIDNLERDSIIAAGSAVSCREGLLDPDLLLCSTCEILSARKAGQAALIAILSAAAGTLERPAFKKLLVDLRRLMSPGDYLLFSADLIKDTQRAIRAYDDSAGLAAAFNRRVLCRINRELGGCFDASGFQYSVRWNALLKRIELHLVSNKACEVYIAELGRRFAFRAGESILTQCFYKYSELDLEAFARNTGFRHVKTWIDAEWAFADVLWQA